MGGDGAFTYALHHPELFSSACPLSAGTGPFTLEEARARLRKDNPAIARSLIEKFYNRQSVLALVNAVPDNMKKSIRWYIDCGDDDFLYEGNSLVHIATGSLSVSSHNIKFVNALQFLCCGCWLTG